MTLRQAANKLESIRNDRHTESQELSKSVDSIGHWLALQSSSKLTMKLLSECHELSARFEINN